MRCNKILLVGGFSLSPYFQRYLRQQLADVGADILTPAKPEAAVLQGMVGLLEYSWLAACCQLDYSNYISGLAVQAPYTTC
jgi:hypothetical protein